MLILNKTFQLLVYIIIVQFYDVNGYSQVITSGSVSANQGPKIFKALNADLIYPKIFNSSDNSISTTQWPMLIPTITTTTTTSTTTPSPLPPYQIEPTSYYSSSQQQQQQPIIRQNVVEEEKDRPIIYVTPPNDVDNVTPMKMKTFTTLQQHNEEHQQHQQDQQAMREQATSHILDDAKLEYDQQQQHEHEQQYASTGRAIDQHPTYPFNRITAPLIRNSPPPPPPPPSLLVRRPPSVGYRPSSYIRPLQAPKRTQSMSSIGKIVYPQAYQHRQPANLAEVNKLKGKAQFTDRFTPGEAVASSLFSNHNHHHQHHNHHHHSEKGKKPMKTSASPTNFVQSYAPSKNLNSFPPNIQPTYPFPPSFSSASSNGVKTYAAPPPTATNGKRKPTKMASASNVAQSYVPPKDLYSFPPNINSKYPSPSEDPKAAAPTSSVNSYSPPPSGPLTSNVGFPLVAASSNENDGYKYKAPDENSGYKYEGPVHPGYLPPLPPPINMDASKGHDNSADTSLKDDNADDADTDNGDDSIGVLPASAMGDTNGDTDSDGGGGGGGGGAGDDDNNMTNDSMDSMDAHDTDHDSDHSLTGYDTGKEYPTPPPGWLEEHPETAHDPPSSDDHAHSPFDYHDHHIPSHYSHYPDIIYDDHFDHHHHHHHPPPPPPPIETTLPPVTTIAPEPPQEPRVKKYSYFYIGRKLWYIPLYFTVWFSFYVLWLILKSIARHKVNLPNHYVNRRSLPTFSDSDAAPTEEYINELTVTVLKQIDQFRKQYSI